LLSAACLGCLSACSGAEKRPNVLIILVDTLRADRIGAFGGERGLSPSIDAWAGGAHVFREAFSHAPWTLPSTASLLTSTYPQQHGAGGVVPLRSADGRVTGGFTQLAEGLPTLAEQFSTHGWRTGCVINVDFLGTKFGLTRGFQGVDEVHHDDNDRVRNAGETTDAALRWLDQPDEKKRPSFLLVHYFDAHATYTPPADFRRKHALPEDKEDQSFRFPTREQMVALRSGKQPLDPALVERAEHLYDGEVAYVDSQIGRLIDGLRSRRLLESTILVFTADHGEEFLDHGGFEHGHTLYDELLHVPLAISWPGHVIAGTSDAPVGLIDVAPTLCELADIAPPASFLGRSLKEIWSGGPVEPRALLAHGNFWGPPLSSIRQGDDVLIEGPAAPGGTRAIQLYDWRNDPGEANDCAGSESELVTSMRKHLDATEQALERRRGKGIDLEQDKELFERLKGFGYVGGDETSDH
jgi:arylsulfatase A-like enzyme